MLVVIVLGQEIGQDVFRLLIPGVFHQEGLSPLDTPRPDMGQMHHGVASIYGHGQHVLLHIPGLNGVLLLHQLADIVDFVPQHRRLLVLHARGGLIHYFRQAVQQFAAVAV